jgi:hypothetical protein
MVINYSYDDVANHYYEYLNLTWILFAFVLRIYNNHAVIVIADLCQPGVVRLRGSQGNAAGDPG